MPLRPEVAKQRLEAFKLAGGRARRLQRIRDLPGTLRDIAEPIVEPPTQDGRPLDYSQWHEHRSKAVHELDRRPPHERRRVFDALFPTVGAHVAAAWDTFRRLPYQGGYARRPFRATREPVTGATARHGWLYQLLSTTEDYEQDAVWLATWAPYLGWGADALGILCAAAIDRAGAEGERVFDVLTASARGEHEIGVMGRHVTRALLVSEREDAWQLVERLLLAAEAQEGLRQTILETVDEAHPTAFRRILTLVVDEGLARFSATVRAVDAWLGHAWDVQHRREVERTLVSLLTYLDSAAARTGALRGGDGSDVYLALWAHAFDDAPGAVEPAAALLHDPSVERRFAALYLLTQLGLVRSQRAALPALDDPDLRVAERALAVVAHGLGEDVRRDAGGVLFEQLERLLARAPKTRTTLPPLLWPWLTLTLHQAEVATALVRNLGDLPTRRLIPYLPVMSPGDRSSVADKLEPDAADARATLFALVGDASSIVRERAIKAIEKLTVGVDEAPKLEALLTRRAGDLRRGVLTLLARQADTAALESAGRLLAGTADQRTAGLELLHELARTGRSAAACRAEARRFQEARPEPSDAERSLLDGLLRQPAPAPSLEDALGLLDPAQRTRPVPPVAPAGLRLVSDAAFACLESLDALVHTHRETPVRLHGWSGHADDQLLGTVRWLRWPDAHEAYLNPYWSAHHAAHATPDPSQLPLRDVWERWWDERPATLRDVDGFELLRAAALLRRYHRSGRSDHAASTEHASRIAALRYPDVTHALVMWLLALRPPTGAADFLLAAFEVTLSQVPAAERAKPADANTPWAGDWRSDVTLVGIWRALARWHRVMFAAQWEDKHHVRLWRALRWLDEPGEPIDRLRPQLGEVARAHRAGTATDADVFEQLLGDPIEGSAYWRRNDDLHRVSGRKGSPLFDECPALRALVDRCRRRILDVELARGELPTAASPPALQLRWSGGLDALVRLLHAYGTRPLVRGWIRGGGQDRASVLSHLIHATFPETEDTPEAFAARVRAARLPRRRLLEVALYAPHWAKHVERALDWPQLEDAVWWLHAHTKDTRWQVDLEIREVWTAQVAERTPLSAHDLLEGAVDVAWFHRVYGALGPERWHELDAAARYASGGGGHKRAQLFADAMRGHVTAGVLVARVRQKRHADSLRALGLAPLAERPGQAPPPGAAATAPASPAAGPAAGPAARDVLDRYQLIQEFLHGSRQFGAQRQESEKLAAAIAMQNLARTAGYRDPNRLRWAMEAAAVADLARGPVTAAAGPVNVTLSVDEWGRPHLAVQKQDRPLRAVPPAAKKDPAVAALVERRRDIDRQASRMRLSLEEAMCRGDVFTGRELRKLMAHPVLRPMLRSLVFIAGEPDAAGYPVNDGRALERHDERRAALDERATLRIAHPHDLLRTGEWHEWQRDCFLRERIQPFKQVFRELYVLTPAELEDATRSRRYAGHQVNPRQGIALLQSRGWVSQPEEGPRRTFHDHGLTASVGVLGGPGTSVEVEGLILETVEFARRGEWIALPLADVPPRVFSEVMRDLDLVVSVAHQGTVDPEASASTVEMRAALLRETCALLKLPNVRLRGSHALVDGALGDYTVHLGSGVVHRQPGGSLCIVPVHGQHRGRLFLPFADDDPKTAEVVSKVLLLARDDQIKDPTILEQILAAP